MKTLVLLVLVIAFIGMIVEVNGTPYNYDAGEVSEDSKVRAKREILLNTVLIELAIKYGAPFATTCLKRLAGDVFGSGRASRSTDVVIFNKSHLKFQTSFQCDYGRYTSSLLPEDEILPKTSSVFGMEGTGCLRGLSCTARYESDNGFFEIYVRNPFFGKNKLSESSSPNLVLTHTLGSGNNNQVRWIVEDVYTDVYARNTTDENTISSTGYISNTKPISSTESTSSTEFISSTESSFITESNFITESKFITETEESQESDD